MRQIIFQEISAATRAESEPGHLVWVRDRLAAILLEAEGGWFLLTGLGPFEAEGLLFPSFAAVELWIGQHLPDEWLENDGAARAPSDQGMQDVGQSPG